MNNQKLEYIKTENLIPYARNFRTHSDAQVAQIAASIKEFGFTNPILIDQNNSIIAGHGRVMAANLLKLIEVPCIKISYLSETQKKAYIIADNKLALNAGWDNDLLAVEFKDLEDLDFNLELTGFSFDEIEAINPVKTEGLTDEDSVPDAPETPKTVKGDIWLLGEHRLMCGDSTSIIAVERLMDGKKADMVFTDPPYGMSYEGGRARGYHALNKKVGVLIKSHGMIIGDDKTGSELIKLIRDSVMSAVAFSKDGASKYVCFRWRTYTEFEKAILECGLKFSACIVWDKKSIGLGISNYRPQHEFIFYVKGGAWYGDKAQSDVWCMSRGDIVKYVHPTQKPVELVEKAIKNSSKCGDIVIDVFGGSGTTIIAAEKNNRICYMMELDKKYCDVIIKRWQYFTGRKAVHAETGVKFDDR